MSEKRRLELRPGNFYRVSNSQMVQSSVRGQIVQCVSISKEKPYEYPRFKLRKMGLTLVEKINPNDITSEVTAVDAQLQGGFAVRMDDDFWGAPPNPLPVNHISESDWAGTPALPRPPIPGLPALVRPITPMIGPVSGSKWADKPPAKDHTEEHETTSDEGPPGIKDLPGKPMTFSWAKNPLDTQHSVELMRNVPRNALVYVKSNSGYCVLRDTGIPDIKFVRWYAKGVTFVRRFRIDDGKADENTSLDTFSLPGFAKLLDIRNYIDSVIIPSSEIVKKGIKSPFRVILKRTVLPAKFFHQRYRPNNSTKNTTTTVYSQATGTYVYPDKSDSSWDSLTEIVNAAIDTQQFEDKHFANCLKQLDKALDKKRLAYKGEYPCVEVYGVWHNYNAESKSFYMKDFEKFPPMMVNFQEFKTPKEAQDYPL